MHIILLFLTQEYLTRGNYVILEIENLNDLSINFYTDYKFSRSVFLIEIHLFLSVNKSLTLSDNNGGSATSTSTTTLRARIPRVTATDSPRSGVSGPEVVD